MVSLGRGGDDGPQCQLSSGPRTLIGGLVNEDITQ
jgi:hypothetical protein